MYGPVIARPVDKRDNYVKRCVAVAGDTMEIRNGKVFVNGVPQEDFPGIQNTYKVVTNGSSINPRIIEKMGLNTQEIYYDPNIPGYPSFPLNSAEVRELEALSNVLEVKQNIDTYPPDFPDSKQMLFPFTTDTTFRWTRDNFGPLWMPEKGASVKLTRETMPLYKRIIDTYEGNDLMMKGDSVFINGVYSDSYTFKMDYFFMLGDNRHNSLDSRYWGFVPESHVVGSPVVIWFSKNNYRSFPDNIRWKRIFKFL
jgi:signal peptidase I